MRKRTGGTRRLPWAMLAVPALAGIPAGILWWVLAPGGLNLITRDPALGTGANPAAWLPRDLTLGVLLLFGGCLLAVFFADGRRPGRHAALLLALAGAALGALLAWQSGMAAARLWGPAVDASANASIAFSLRAWPVLLLGPGAAAAAVFVLELLDVGSPKGAGRGAGAERPAAEP